MMRLPTILLFILLTGCMPGPTSTTSIVLDETAPADRPADADPADEPNDDEDDSQDDNIDGDEPVEDNRPYVMGQLPTLAATGLYADNSFDLADGVQDYEPRFPLYSDTLEKRRYISIPANTAIDARSTELWDFPVGTRLWKEFRLGRGNASRILETRYMEKRENQWVFATYVWNEDQTAANLWDGREIEDAAQVRIQGRVGEQTADVSIPSFDQCLTCHIQHGANDPERPDPVLGFSAVQLDLSTMRDLRDAEQLSGIRLSRSAHAIPARNDQERRVIGYMHANCGHCHNPRRPEFIQPTRNRSFLLNYNISNVRTRDDINLLSLINQPIFNQTVFIPGVSPELTKGIVPGRPDSSMLYYRMRHARGAQKMPKLGAASRDLDFIEGRLRTWIQTLPPR